MQEHARHPAAALQVDPDSLVSQRRASGDVYSPLLKKNASSELEIKGLPRPIENAVIWKSMVLSENINHMSTELH